MDFIRTIIVVLVLFVAAAGLPACSSSLTEAERMQVASKDYDRGRYRKALIETKNILQSNPGNVNARLLLGKTSLKLGDAAAAEKEFARVKDLGASIDDYYVLELQAKKQLGKYDEIVASFSAEDIRDKTTRELARIYYADSLYRIGDLSSAEDVYRSLLNTSSDDSVKQKSYLGLGELSRAEGDSSGAVENIRSAYDLNPNSAETLVAYGQQLLRDKDFEGALRIFKRGGEIAGASTRERIVLAAGELETQIALNDLDGSKIASNQLYTLAPKDPRTNYLLARVAHMDGDKEGAYEYIQESQSKAPSFIPAIYFNGVLNMERGEFEQAAALLETLVGAQPDNTAARKLLAQAYLKLNNPDKAERLIRQAVASGKADQEMVNLLVRASTSTGDREAAIANLERSIALYPNDADLPWSLASLLLSAGRASEAVELLQKTGVGADDVRTSFVDFLAAVEREDNVKARELAQSITSTWPDQIPPNRMVARWYANQGEVEKAQVVFNRNYEKFPDDIEALTDLASLKIQQEQLPMARQLYQDYITRNPDSENALMALGYVYQLEGDSSTGLKYIELAHERNPESEVPLLALTRIHLFNKNLGKAKRYAQKAVSANPESAMALQLRGEVAASEGDYESALNTFSMAMELNPNSADILLRKARAEIELGLFEQARDSYRRLRVAAPDDLDLAKVLAQLEMHTGEIGRAEKIVDDWIVASPDNPVVIELLGDIEKEKGDRSAASTAYARAYKLNPSRTLTLKQYRLARVQGENGVPYLNEWLRLSPEDQVIRQLLAQNFAAEGDQSAAIAQYEKLLLKEPDSALVLNNLAWLYFEQNSNTSSVKALDLAKRAHDLASTNPQIVDTYGWILFNSGDVEASIEVLARAEAMARELNNDSLPDIVYHNAVALESAGDRSAARNKLHEILSGVTEFSTRDEAQLLYDTL